jgi:hypothetical protein
MPSHKNFRFPPLTESNATLALRPLLIPGMVEPVQDGDGGISIKIATDDPNGLQCVINPYLHPMSEGDKLEIYANNEKVLERFVEADEVNQRVFFYLPTPVESGWIENCHYVLTRVDATVPDPPSAALRIWVKLYKPGNRDKEPHLPDGHSELNIVQLPPELVEQGEIDAEWAKRGVPATIPQYVFSTRNDQVRLQLGDYWLPAHRITKAQADGQQPIVILIDQDAILGAGDGLRREIKYFINDEVWNWADRHSKRTSIDVDAGGWRLEAPIIKEAINGVITIRDLNKLPVTIQIHVRSEYFAVGDSVKMTFTGTPPNNGEPIICSETRDIENVPSVLEIPVPYELIRVIAQGRADAFYILYKKDGGAPLSSKRAIARVEGDVNILPEPSIRELMGDTLDPDELYATVDVRYDMKNGDLICLIWSGIKSNGDDYRHEVPHIVTGNEAKEGLVTFYIDSEHISVLDNGTLDLSYVVANDAFGLYDIRESERLLAKVEKVRATLPAPEVEEADPPGDVLDPSKVFDRVHVWISEAKTLSKDVLTYYWRSPNPFASTSDWLPITTVTEGQPVRFPVDAKFVTGSIGYYVEVRYSLKSDATGLYSHSATLNLMVGYLIGDLPPPKVIQAPDDLLDPMQALNGVDVQVEYESMDSDLDTIGLDWIGTPGAGTSQDLVEKGNDSGSVVFRLPASAVGPNINRTVDVSYKVHRYSRPTDSESLSLRVLSFQDPENDLPRPEVPQSQNRILDLMTFSGDARTLLAQWPFIALKQRIWLYLIGQTTTGATYPIKIIPGAEITPAQVTNGLNEALLRSELMKLGHSTPANLICKVAFDGSENEDTACLFPQLPLTIRTRYDYVQPVITAVTDSRGDVEEGGKTRDEKVTVTGTATRGETVELFDGTTTSMGTALVDADTTWSREIGPLTEKPYRISAKALYDADPVSSDPRTFTVKFAQTPEILSVTDSRGDVAHGTTTYDSSVQVAGSATPNLQVKLLENKQPLITLDVDDKGDWNHRLNDLKVRSYSLTAEALYEIDPAISPPRDFIVAQAVTPTISRVSDLRGEVAANGTTYYRTVTLRGKASPNEKIILLNAGANVETVDVNGSGDWQHVFSNLNLTTYRLTARGDYGSNPESSPPRVFTVAAFVSPTITAVTDSVGTVGPNGTTYDTAVTVKGEATPREQIQMYDNGAPVGTPVSVNADKQWTTSVTGLAIRSHSLTAKAMYDAVPVESPARNFNVAAHIAPTLTSVHDGISEIGNGGTTKRTSVTLRGNVTPNREVQVYDNNNPKHTVRAVGDAWSTTLAVGVGDHSLKVKAVSTGQESQPPRTFKVLPVIPPLTINQATMSLNAWHFRNSGLTPSNPPAGAYGDRSAQGGQPPYRYSSNSNAAEVHPTTGRVISRGNGSATITVTDGANQSASYMVTTSNVEVVFGTGQFNTYTQCSNAAASMGGRIPSLAEWRSFISNYSGRGPIDRWSWASDSAGFGKRYVIYPATGQTDVRIDIGIGGGTADGFGIKRG